MELKILFDCRCQRPHRAFLQPIQEAFEEARAMLDALDLTKPAGLYDRALVALTVYAFARLGAALQMRMEDV
jgi:hypothetical protein